MTCWTLKDSARKSSFHVHDYLVKTNEWIFFKSAVFFHSFQQIMKTIFYLGCLLTAFFELCMSDIYMHVPPGSNNRINGEGDNVQNANRLFDSQVRSSFHCYKTKFSTSIGHPRACFSHNWCAVKLSVEK